jgi:hypothetical protein
VDLHFTDNLVSILKVPRPQIGYYDPIIAGIQGGCYWCTEGGRQPNEGKSRDENSARNLLRQMEFAYASLPLSADRLPLAVRRTESGAGDQNE